MFDAADRSATCSARHPLGVDRPRRCLEPPADGLPQALPAGVAHLAGDFQVRLGDRRGARPRAGPDDDPAQLVLPPQLLEQRRLDPLADREARHQREAADGHAQHGEGRPHLAAGQGRHREHQHVAPAHGSALLDAAVAHADDAVACSPGDLLVVRDQDQRRAPACDVVQSAGP